MITNKFNRKFLEWMNDLIIIKYRNILQWLCRRELKKIADKYPNTVDELIKWHDFMAIECINAETKGRERMLGICIGTSNALDNK